MLGTIRHFLIPQGLVSVFHWITILRAVFFQDRCSPPHHDIPPPAEKLLKLALDDDRGDKPDILEQFHAIVIDRPVVAAGAHRRRSGKLPRSWLLLRRQEGPDGGTVTNERQHGGKVPLEVKSPIAGEKYWEREDNPTIRGAVRLSGLNGIDVVRRRDTSWGDETARPLHSCFVDLDQSTRFIRPACLLLCGSCWRG